VLAEFQRSLDAVQVPALQLQAAFQLLKPEPLILQGIFQALEISCRAAEDFPFHRNSFEHQLRLLARDLCSLHGKHGALKLDFCFLRGEHTLLARDLIALIGEGLLSGYLNEHTSCIEWWHAASPFWKGSADK
jgi:hypothetical protein